MNQPLYIPTNFREFFLALPKEHRARFAELAGTTETYIAVKLVRAKSVPRPEQMERLWSACKAYRAPFTRADLLNFFYPEPAGESGSTPALAAVGRSIPHA